MQYREAQTKRRRYREHSAEELLLDAEGRERRPVLGDRLMVPAKIEFDESVGELAWSTGLDGPAFNAVEPNERVLLDFMNLAEAPPTRFLQCARRWGVLGLCKPHGLPFTHNWENNLMTLRDLGFNEALPDIAREADHLSAAIHSLAASNEKYQAQAFSPVLRCSFGWPAEVREPLEVWRRFARHAAAIVRTANRLHDNMLEDEVRREDRSRARADLERLEPGTAQWPDEPDEPRVFRRFNRLDYQRMLVERAVNYWLGLAAARPYLKWKPPARIRSLSAAVRPSVVLGGPQYSPNLFGYLAVQLMFRVTQIGVLGSCVVCGKVYEPRIRPKRNQHNYCPECRESGAAARFRAADNYRRTTRRKGRKR